MQPFHLTAPHTPIHPLQVIDEANQVVLHLQELNPKLTVSLFVEAIRGGLEARNEATPASAPTAAGIQQWLKTLEGLRTQLAAQGWQIHNQQNGSFIGSPERTLSIVVMTGSVETGKNEGKNPTNQTEKGRVTQGFVQQNGQLSLFQLNQQAAFQFAKKSVESGQKDTQVWVLLYHYDKRLNEVRFELSLPTVFDRGRITAWGIRLILGSLPNQPSDFTLDGDIPNAPPTVNVKPKAQRL